MRAAGVRVHVRLRLLLGSFLPRSDASASARDRNVSAAGTAGTALSAVALVRSETDAPF